MLSARGQPCFWHYAVSADLDRDLPIQSTDTIASLINSNCNAIDQIEGVSVSLTLGSDPTLTIGETQFRIEMEQTADRRFSVSGQSEEIKSEFCIEQSFIPRGFLNLGVTPIELDLFLESDCSTPIKPPKFDRVI
jgi:hypothetical protein